MSYNTLHIIHRLKQQPKQGMPTPDPNDAAGMLKSMLGDNALIVRGAQQVAATMEELADKVYKVADGTRYLEDRNADLSKSLGISINAATKLGGMIDKNAKSFGVGGAKLRQYIGNLKSLIGSFATLNDLIEDDYGKTLINTQKIFVNSLKLTDQQANAFIKYSAGLKKDSTTQLLATQEMAKAIEKQTGTQGVFLDLLEGVSALTEDLQIQYSRIPGSLELGVLKAKALGLEMSDLQKTGEDLLDIESSIGQELEYQLISGRRLVDQQSGKSLTNMYREATLRGDASKQADIMNQLLEQEGDTLKNNLFARKQMSDLLGTDEATLARALQKKEILEKIGGESLFKLTGNELTDAVKAIDGLTQSEKEAAIAELEKNQDLRTTDQKIQDVLGLMTTQGIAAMIKNPQDIQKAIADATVGGMTGVAEGLLPGATPGSAKAAGAAVTIASGVVNITDAAVNLLKPATWTSMVNQKTPGKDVANDVTGQPVGYADGGVVPAGYPSDTYPALLTSGETVTPAGGFDQFAAAIVSAINNQTRALTNNTYGGGMNAPYYG
jgi:hypothetical protein